MSVEDAMARRQKRKPNTVKPMNAIMNKLEEPSTIRGLIALLAAFGMTIQPEYHTHIVAGCLALIGAINVYRKEPKIPKAEVVE